MAEGHRSKRSINHWLNKLLSDEDFLIDKVDKANLMANEFEEYHKLGREPRESDNRIFAKVRSICSREFDPVTVVETVWWPSRLRPRLAIRLALSTLSIKKSSSLLVRNDGIAVFPPRRVLAPKLLGVFVQFIRHIWPRSITIALSKLPQQLSNTLWLCKIKGCVRRWYAVSFCFDIREE